MERDVEENIFDCFGCINSQNLARKRGGFEESAAVVGGIVNGFAEAGFQKWGIVASVE